MVMTDFTIPSMCLHRLLVLDTAGITALVYDIGSWNWSTKIVLWKTFILHLLRAENCIPKKVTEISASLNEIAKIIMIVLKVPSQNHTTIWGNVGISVHSNRLEFHLIPQAVQKWRTVFKVNCDFLFILMNLSNWTNSMDIRKVGYG